jgi:hypothetical protein
MSVKITNVSASQQAGKLRIEVHLKNESDEQTDVILEAVLRGQDPTLPVSVRQIGVKLEPHADLTQVIYDFKDNQILPGKYIARVGFADRIGEGSAAEVTFQIKTPGIL